jgi:hypothetical protein
VIPRASLAAAASVVVLALAAPFACGPVEPPPPSTDVTNVCPCGGYQAEQLDAGLPLASCSGGICVSNLSSDPLLVIEVPESSRNYPGITMTIQRSALSSPNTEACHGSCVQLPLPAGDIGSLALDPLVGAATGIGVDFGNGGGRTSIPVQVQYFPLWAVTGTSAGASGLPTASLVPASQIGLPLLPLRALSAIAPVSGPNGSPGYGWRLSLGAGDYVREIVPVDDRFPPSSATLHIASVGGQEESLVQVDDQATPANRQLTIDWPLHDLRGFQAYLRDRTTHRRMSSRVTITDPSPGPVTLNTFGIPVVGATSANLEKVVEPPEGSLFPTFADPLLALDTIGTAAIPFLPDPVTVSGSTEAGGRPVESDLIFTSTTFNVAANKGGITIISDPTQGSDRNAGRRALHYTTTVHTPPSTGRFSVLLPPGEFEIFVRPTDPSLGGGATMLQEFYPNKPARAQTQTASQLGVLRGTVHVADGRPLPRATIEARPGASLASAGLDPRTWPRVRSTTTDDTGAFVLPVDPGVIDLAVEPVVGTGFPVITRSALTVAPGATLDFDAMPQPLVIPAPVAIDLVLHDAADNPVAGALVRAFDVSSNAPPVPPGSTAALIEIGSWRSDATGHLQMLVVPPH